MRSGYLFKNELLDKVITNYPDGYLKMLSIVQSGDKRDLISKLFGEGFYDFLIELSKLKMDLQKDHYKNQSKLLQSQESDLLNKVMNRCCTIKTT